MIGYPYFEDRFRGHRTVVDVDVGSGPVVLAYAVNGKFTADIDLIAAICIQIDGPVQLSFKLGGWVLFGFHVILVEMFLHQFLLELKRGIGHLGMGICRRYALNESDAGDVLNDGFLKVFTHIDKYETSKPFKTWFAKIITNTAIDKYRLNLKFSNHDDISGHEHLGQEAPIHADLAYKELLHLIQGLSPAYRVVFNLYAIDGYTHEEIAALLNISVGTSKSNLFKARQNCRKD